MTVPLPTHLQHLLMGVQGVSIQPRLQVSIRGGSWHRRAASAELRPSSASLCQVVGSCAGCPGPSLPCTAVLAAAEWLDLALVGDTVARTAG